MYNYIAEKYGEDRIAAFVVHLDETTPHAHCVVVPIDQEGKLSFKNVFAGNDKYEFSKRTKQLWDEAALIAEKYYRGGNSATQTGFGLGMYLAKTYMEKQGGGMEYYNDNGFVVELLLRKV